MLYWRFSLSRILFLLFVASLKILLDVADVGVEDDVLFEFDDDDCELLLDDGARRRLKIHRIALDNPSPIVDK